MVDLRPDQLATVQSILRAVIPNHEVWAFGSRAKWTAHDSSDLDLAIITDHSLPIAVLGRLHRAFEESFLSFKVDVVDWSQITEEFRSVIRKQHVVIQEPIQSETSPAESRGWKSLPLEECVETIIDYHGKTPRKVPAGIPLITAKIIKNGRIDKPTEFIAPENYVEWMRRGLPKSGDVLLTMEAPLGEVAQLDDRKVALAQRLVALRGKPGLLDNTFLKFMLRSSQAQHQLKAHATGTTVLGIRQSELRKINLMIPPLAEQHAIAHVLGTLDDKIESNRRTNETLEALAQALFRRMLDKAKRLEAVPLPEVIEVNPPRPLRKGEIAPYLDMANMPTRSARALEVYNRQFGSGTRFMDGDTLVARITPCLENGKTCFVDFLGPGNVGWGSTEYIVLRPKLPLPPEFAYFLARTEDFRAFAISNMTGTSGRQRVSVDCLDHFRMEVPPVELTDRFGQFARTAFAKMKAADEESRTLAALRDMLLPKLLTGRLRLPVEQSSEAAS